MNILCVGAGFAGATAARLLAEAGHQVLVIDKRDHVAGNAYDYVNEHGIRVHKYGPHLWHTSNDDVQAWASRFTEWVPYRHKVKALLKNGVYTPLPINRQTIEDVFQDKFSAWFRDHSADGDDPSKCLHQNFIEQHGQIPTVTGEPENSRQHVESSVGKVLCDVFFEPYTKKMWGLSLDQLPASVAARIPTNIETNSDEYFPKDKHQFLPAEGYTTMVSNILNHYNIKVQLSTSRQDIDQTKFDHVFTTEPIDTYFNCELGELQWRSIRMHTVSIALNKALPASVVNFTNDGPYTRVTEWKQLPAHGENDLYTTLTWEEPCDYRDNDMERYYPVKTTMKDCPVRALYEKYREKAESLPNVTFCGRQGLAVYMDMHMAISSTMAIVKRFIAANS